jgi:hypothetical protein
MSRAYQEPRSWRELLDRCLMDRQRFRRLLVLVLVVSGFTVALVAIAGWPLAGMGAFTAYLASRHRSRRTVNQPDDPP